MSTSSVSSSTSAAIFQASGLASGLDTTSIVNQLVLIAQQPLDNLKAQQSAYTSQISQLGNLATKLSALQTAADALSKNGVLGIQTTSSNVSYSATPTSNATPGTYSIQVTSLATAAKARSQAFSSNTAPVKGATLKLSVQGTTTNVTIADGEALSDVAKAINQSGAAVTATVISDGISSYLSISNQNTGYTIGQAASTALSITETSTGTLGQPLSAVITSTATNSQMVVDGLTVNRTTNTVSDVIPGVTLTLKTQGGAAENLSLATDSNQTAQNLNQFVNAYNDIAKLLSQELNINNQTNRNTSLAGDHVVRSIQSQLQSLTSTVVPGLSGANSLASLGIKTAEDGTISLDTPTLQNALSQNPSSINALFSTATTGLDAKITSLVSGFADPATGLLTQEQQSLQSNIRSLTLQENQMQQQLDAYRQTLINQFTAMEQVVSGYKSTANYLTSQSLTSGG